MRLAADGLGYEGELSVTAEITDVTELRVTNIATMKPFDPPNAPAILASAIQVTPNQAQAVAVGERASFLVRMPQPMLPGTFCGQVDVVYRGQAGVERYTVPLQLQATSPQLTVTPTRLTLAQARPGDPYLGTFTVEVTGGEVSRLVLTKRDLVRSDEQPGYIPASALTVSPDTVAMTPGDAPLTVTVSVTSTVEGAYQGPLVLSFFGPSATKAQTTIPVTLNVTTKPQAVIASADNAPLTVTGYTGGSTQAVVSLREGSKTADARNVTGQLVNTWLKDNPSKKLLPQPIASSEATIARDGSYDLSVPLTFQGAKAGLYNGTLEIGSDNAPKVTMPVVLNLKHHWCWPLPFLVAGMMLGGYLAWYTSRRRDWDTLTLEIIAEHDRLDEKQANDPRFYEFYGDYARSQLNAAADLLHDDLPAKKTEIEAIRDKVRGFRIIWHNHGRRLHEERVRIEETITNTKYQEYQDDYPYVRIALRALDDIHEARHESKTGDELRAKVNVEVTKLEEWDNVRKKIEDLNGLLENLKRENQKKKDVELERKIVAQGENLARATIDFEKAATEPEVDAVKNAIPNMQTELKEIWKKLNPDDNRRHMLVDSANAMNAIAGESVNPPQAKPQPSPMERLRETVPLVLIRLSAYKGIIFVISVVVLSGFGMNELYVNNATFGASFFDYLKLFVWGLGANATTSGFAQLISTYGAKVGVPAQGK